MTLESVRHLRYDDPGQLLVQWKSDMGVPRGTNITVQFYAVDDQAEQRWLGETNVRQKGSANARHTEIVDGKLEPGEGLMAKAFAGDPVVEATSEVVYPQSGQDVDTDGIDDEIEDMAPGGDGNRDGIPDRSQRDVTSLPSRAGASS